MVALKCKPVNIEETMKKVKIIITHENDKDTTLEIDSEIFKQMIINSIPDLVYTKCEQVANEIANVILAELE